MSMTVGYKRSLRVTGKSREMGVNAYLAKALGYNPVAFYPLTVNGNDYSGNGYHGTLTGDAVIQAATGVDGLAAMYLPMTDDYLNVYSVGLASVFNGDEFCIGGWFKQEPAALSDGVWHDLLVFYNSDLANYIFVRSLNGNLSVARAAPTLQSWNPILSGFGTGWRHVMFRCTLAGGNIQLYLDGVGPGGYAPNGNWSNGLNSSAALFGASPSDPKIHEWFGWMQYVGIWPVLSAAQILDLATI